MRVTVTTTGDVVVDTDSPAQAAAFVRELRNGSKKKAVRQKKPRPLAIESAEEPLSQELADTWNWLVAYDNTDGVSMPDVAAGLDLIPATAGYRLRQLIAKGLAHQPARGRFRPGDA